MVSAHHHHRNHRRSHRHSHGGSSPASVSTTPTSTAAASPTPTTVASPTPTTVASPTSTTAASQTPTTAASPTPTTTQATSSNLAVMGSFLFQGIFALVHFIFAILAIYLSIKCNKGFNLGDFLLACCCPMCYVPIRVGFSGFCQ